MKKFMAILATALVMALSATSVFAAGSPSTTVGAVTEAGVEVYVSDLEFTSSQVTASDAAVEDELTKKYGSDDDIEVIEYYDIATLDISAPANWDGNPVTLTINVPGVAAGDNIVVVNYNRETDEWDSMTVVEVGNGYIKVVFTHFSPVKISGYKITWKDEPNSWYYDPEIDGPVDPSKVSTTSPKTGVLPVAAITATICLAGAAVCGKKVK